METIDPYRIGADWNKRYELTYEGWKLWRQTLQILNTMRYELTYEGWKPPVEADVAWNMTRYELTYEGWKL